MSQRDVVGEHAPDEKDNLVEMNRAAASEYPPQVESVSEAIKDKQTNSSKRASSSFYLAIFQWILLIFCVSSNIYLLSKPQIKCECDGSDADSIMINPSTFRPTASPQIITSSLLDSLQPSSQPTTNPTVGSSVMSSIDPTLSPSMNPTTAPSMIPYIDPTLSPSIQPKNSPVRNPSFIPTMTPSSRPTSSPSKYPTDEPSAQPTRYPSQSPTYFDGYFIADYKYSFRNTSHGFWMLCDGQWLDIVQYSMLYNEIGYQFGHLYDSSNDISYFRLPDARDTVMGVIGSVHQMNERVGNETHVLAESEIPQHYHYIASLASSSNCGGYASVDGTGSYLSERCYGNYVDYSLQRSTYTPNMFQTGAFGSNQSFSVMQPTKFIGNLFIYSGREYDEYV